MPTFSLEELKTVVETARSAGAPSPRTRRRRRACAARYWRASNDRARRRRHGRGLPADGGAQRGALSHPAAGDANPQYRVGRRARTRNRRDHAHEARAFKAALADGVTIVSGSDVGVFTHGDTRVSWS